MSFAGVDDGTVFFGDDTEAGYVAHGRPGNRKPQFIGVRRSDRTIGRPIDALCCNPELFKEGADRPLVKRADVQFGGADAGGVSGAVLFSQTTPTSQQRSSNISQCCKHKQTNSTFMNIRCGWNLRIGFFGDLCSVAEFETLPLHGQRVRSLH